MAVPRFSDEFILRLVRLRSEGKSSGEVARLTGISSAQVRVLTNRVRAEDLARSKEPTDAVQKHYWPTGQKGV